jgi:hypothetical protein
MQSIVYHYQFHSGLKGIKKKAPRWGFPVGETGLEPATFAMSTQCSNQLSYPPRVAEKYYNESGQI